MSCCTKTYNFGCFESCESITDGITVSQTGVFTVRLMPTMKDIATFERANGQTLIIPNQFNEMGISVFQIINPDGTVFTYTDGGTTYDCFQIENRLTTDPSRIPVGADCEDATAIPVNSDGTQIGSSVTIAAGAAGNVPADDTPITSKNSGGTTVKGPVSFPSGVAGDFDLDDITLDIEDQDGNSLFSGSKEAGVDITQAVTVDKSTIIQLPFEEAADDTTGLFTVTSFNAGTYTAADPNTGSDGGSGTITWSINGGAYAAFPATQALVAGNTLQAKRTTTGATGYAQAGGTYT